MPRQPIDDFLRERLALLRKESGLTQASAAELAGISEIYLKSIEQGVRYNLPVHTLEKLLKIYGLGVPDIFQTILPKAKISIKAPKTPHYQRRKGKK